MKAQNEKPGEAGLESMKSRAVMRLEVTKQYGKREFTQNIDFVLSFLLLVTVINDEQYVNWLFGSIDDHGLPKPSVD